MEMTGLNPDVNEIIEAAVIVTDSELNIIEEGPNLVLHQNQSVFETMDEWNKSHHTKSGLWEKVVASTLSVGEAESKILDFLKPHFNRNTGILAGNSIWQDRRFICKYMPNLDSYLHYRMLDVSSIKIAANYWLKFPEFKKENSHRALDDIKESIAELKHYKQHCFNLKAHL